ncbi:hypothetical protein TNCT_484121 [Trichonephila clavata]|uniref:Uncharacterized protein n=1 Tax=Trichonephila clavata TaxID=2740835 RepID=A0A8X6FIJ7_TRICU|nr:hypothetical protein TNCT_484121 [Trichonephila clavata]
MADITSMEGPSQPKKKKVNEKLTEAEILELLETSETLKCFCKRSFYTALDEYTTLDISITSRPHHIASEDYYRSRSTMTTRRWNIFILMSFTLVAHCIYLFVVNLLLLPDYCSSDNYDCSATWELIFRTDNLNVV